MMKHWLPLALLTLGTAAVHAADPQEVWEQAVKAKGGRDRLHDVHSLAIYLKPAKVNLAGPPTTWLCVFPDRYFEFDGPGSGRYPMIGPNGAISLAGSPRAIVVDATADRVAMDANGTPRAAWRLTSVQFDRLTLNQIVFLLDSAWLRARPVEVKRNVLTVEAGGHTFRIRLSTSNLPERVQMVPGSRGEDTYEYRLEHYAAVQGIQLPSRVALITGTRQWTWDADYEVDSRFNPKFFRAMPDLGRGPEPWR